MASVVMHLCISQAIKENHAFSNKFLYASILPDILKFTKYRRYDTHYMSSNLDKDVNIDRFINKYSSLIQSKDEVTCGYLAHLIQDKIWFSKYCLSELMTKDEYEYKVYNSFPVIDRFLLKHNNLDINELCKLVFELTESEEEKQQIIKAVRIAKIEYNDILFDLTFEQLKEFQDECIFEFDKIIKERW